MRYFLGFNLFLSFVLFLGSLDLSTMERAFVVILFFSVQMSLTSLFDFFNKRQKSS